MPQSVTIEEAQAKLPELIAGLSPGEDLVIFQNQKAIAHLQLVQEPKKQPVFGSCKGQLTILAEDDEHLNDFREFKP